MTGDNNTQNIGRHSKFATEITLHASCIAVDGRGLLILGESGSGKSGLALSMMALGAKLVGDDRVTLSLSENAIIATVPGPISGLIEARGIGLLNAPSCGPVPVVCVVDLDQTETIRMPPERQIDFLGQTLTLLFKVNAPHFAAGLIQYLKQGRQPE